jgi:hypothetical protein
LLAWLEDMQQGFVKDLIQAREIAIARYVRAMGLTHAQLGSNNNPAPEPSVGPPELGARVVVSARIATGEIEGAIPGGGGKRPFASRTARAGVGRRARLKNFEP